MKKRRCPETGAGAAADAGRGGGGGLPARGRGCAQCAGRRQPAGADLDARRAAGPLRLGGGLCRRYAGHRVPGTALLPSFRRGRCEGLRPGAARKLWLLEPEEYTVLKETPDTLVLANYEDGPGFHQTLLLVVDGPDVLFLHYWGGGAWSADVGAAAQARFAEYSAAARGR